MRAQIKNIMIGTFAAILSVTCIGSSVFHISFSFPSSTPREVLQVEESTNVEPRLYRFGDDVIRVWPISFSAPEETWVPVVQYKVKGFANLIPGNVSTYIYHDEDAYFQEYRYATFQDRKYFSISGFFRQAVNVRSHP